MNEREDLELLLARIQQTREAQISYVLQKNPTNERKKVKAEQALDGVMKAMVKKGYNPDRFKTEVKPANLF